MAVDMYIKIDGIDGESKDAKHENEIDVLAWSWGMSQSGSMHTGGGGSAGKVNVQDLSFTKYVDKSSPALMKYCCSGEGIKKGATLVVRKAGGKEPVEYLKIEMAPVMISSISTGGSGGEDRLTENVTLNFKTVKQIYQEQDEDNNPKGGPVEQTWNIEKNTEKV